MSGDAVTMSAAGAEALRRLLAAWLAGEPPPAVAAADIPGLVAAIRRNRLEPLGHPAGWAVDPVSAASFREVYVHALRRGLRFLQEGARMCGLLAGAGIPCLAWRGAFAGARLYGDVGLRRFTDLDLLVPPERAWAAWRIFRREGYRVRGAGTQAAFYRLFHLHWPLDQQARGIFCDLHWRIDHPFQLSRVDVPALLGRTRPATGDGGEVWPEAEPADAFLLACAHVAKETRGLAWDADPARNWTRLVDAGLVPPWLDAARLVTRTDLPVDWPEAHRRAEAWRLGEAVSLTAAGLRAWFGVAIPGERPARMAAPLAPVSAPTAAEAHLAAAGGFRPARLREAAAYVFPDPRRPGAPRTVAARTAHAFAAVGRLGLAAVGVLACAAGRSLSRAAAARRRAAAGLVLLGAAISAPGDLFPDDIPDTSAGARAVGTDGTPQGGIIEIDPDADRFAFSALPGLAYGVTVTASNIFDCALELLAPDGVTRLGETNTARQSAPPTATIVWTNPGAAARVHARVRGLFAFTTGAYAVAVQTLNGADVDADGLPDAWETRYFGSLAQGAAGDFDGDGFVNRDEFLAATIPTNPASVFRITEVLARSNTVSLVWPAAAYGAYRYVGHTGTLVNAVWDPVGTQYHGDPSGGTERVTFPAVTNQRYRLYRVELVY